MPSIPIPTKQISLGVCTCTPTAEYRPHDGEWVIRLSLEYPGTQAGSQPSFLPLFVHVRREGQRITAELESDQTDYRRPDVGWRIKRAVARGLRFWSRQG